MVTNPQADELVEVIQADRDAAAELIEYLAGGLTASSRKMRKGEADDYEEVRAFARHRQSHTAAAVAAERERCAQIADAPLMHRKGRIGLWRQRRADIAAAIRSTAPEGGVRINA